MTVGELRFLLSCYPDSWTVEYGDPNFGGPLIEYQFDKERIEVDDDYLRLLITFPCIEAVD